VERWQLVADLQDPFIGGGHAVAIPAGAPFDATRHASIFDNTGMTSAPSPSDSLVVVTGASMGIGLEIALCAARDGHPLLLVARTESALETAATAVRDAGSPAVHVLSADLSLDEGVAAVRDKVEELDLPVAALVNNAGVGAWGPFAEQDPERLAKVIDLNDKAVVVLTRHLIDRIKAAKGGVLNVASTAAFQPGPGMNVYHASKAFALFFSLALREELLASGVRVTALCPGPVTTGFAGAAGIDDSVETSLRYRLTEVSAEKVARMAWRGLAKNKAIVMPGAVNRVGALGARLGPMSLVTKIARGALGAVDAKGVAIRS
jgi:short-subunit dehydrogenase